MDTTMRNVRTASISDAWSPSTAVVHANWDHRQPQAGRRPAQCPVTESESTHGAVLCLFAT